MNEIKKAEKMMHDAIYDLDLVSVKDGDVLIVNHNRLIYMLVHLFHILFLENLCQIVGFPNPCYLF